MKRVMGAVAVVAAVSASLLAAAQLSAQTQGAASPQPAYKRLTGPQTYNPGPYPNHFPYPDQYNAVAASPEVHHLRYTDAKVDLVEVAYFPGVRGQMHGHPFPSVFAMSAPGPRTVDVRLDADRAPVTARSAPPDGMAYPICMLMNPQAPHAPTNQDTFPNHFYRLAFKRVDGAEIQSNWRTWYPRMLDPPLSRKAARENSARHFETWPYAIALDSILAAPNNYRLLFENDEMRLVEVMLRPGETTPLHGDPYPAVIAMDAVSDAQPTEKLRFPQSPLNGQGAKNSGALPGFPSMNCTTTPPRAPRTITNGGKAPVHYYRIEFKRINGPAIRENWRTWYPWLARLADETAKNPYASNY